MILWRIENRFDVRRVQVAAALCGNRVIFSPTILLYFHCPPLAFGRGAGLLLRDVHAHRGGSRVWYSPPAPESTGMKNYGSYGTKKLMSLENLVSTRPTRQQPRQLLHPALGALSVCTSPSVHNGQVHAGLVKGFNRQTQQVAQVYHICVI